jgi:hypothetical protein
MTADELWWFEAYDPQEFDDDGAHLMAGAPRWLAELAVRQRRLALRPVALAMGCALALEALAVLLVLGR